MDNILNKWIGIIGGGQLGKMMILEAKKLGLKVIILDPNENCPAKSISDKHIIADFHNQNAIRELANLCDILTYELEHIDADVLMELEDENKKIYPTAKSLKIIQDKFLQKQILKDNSIPTPDFYPVNSCEDIHSIALKWGYNMVLKTTKGGYDGKGNAFIKNEGDVLKAYDDLGGEKKPMMVEKFVDFEMETSVLACRGINGETVVYEAGENIHKNNILIETRVPANIHPITKEKIRIAASKVMEIFQGVGMFCIEMFIKKNGDILINEIAPRPHNSGHYTIEACITSQFEQHIRSIMGLPLGDVTLLKNAVMRNILGEDKYFGQAKVVGLCEALQIKGVSVHIYGKESTVPFRKMGHITAIADSLQEAEEKCRLASENIHIIS